jgi:GTP-binding protein
MMIIKNAEFIISCTELKKCPKPEKPEYAFIGRSNVGKSSLINMITDIRHLAKTSTTPGKTQLINFFLINESWYLVDLPGIGYAKAAKSAKSKWEKMILNYISKRQNLLSVFYLVDIRIAPQQIDLNFMEWLGENQIPFVILFTKADKITRTVLDKNISLYKKTLIETWEELPQMIITSSEKKTGKEEILDFIELTNKVFTSE